MHGHDDGHSHQYPAAGIRPTYRFAIAKRFSPNGDMWRATYPHSGVVYVFRAKKADRVKLIWWDGTGLCLMAKRLEQGVFHWPAIHDGVMRLTSAQFGALLEGLDWRRVHAGRRPQAPQLAG
jgi:transposase